MLLKFIFASQAALFRAAPVNSGDGRPAQAGVTVALLPNDYSYRVERGRTRTRARTDAEGRFQLTNVPAGSFRIAALASVLVLR